MPSDRFESIPDVKVGVSTGSIVESHRGRKKRQAKLRAEQERWQKLNGPVVTYVDHAVRIHVPAEANT